MMSDVRYEIKNFITCYLTWNFDTKKSGLVRTQRTEQLILVDPVEEDVEDSSTDWSSKRLTMRSKENVRILTLIRSTLLSIIAFYITLAWLIFLMWSQINVLLSIRLTGGRQTGFKDLKPLKAKKIFVYFSKF